MYTLFRNLNKIDKTQFPFPYCQIVKLLLIIWLFTVPFILAESVGWATPLVMPFIALGFCGLDEVAENIESPFGTPSCKTSL